MPPIFVLNRALVALNILVLNRVTDTLQYQLKLQWEQRLIGQAPIREGSPPT